ncbi:STM4014 family protein [Paenibacillus sp. CAU 1782]
MSKNSEGGLSSVQVRPLIVIGQPGDRRTEGIQSALDKLSLPPAVIVPFADALGGEGVLEKAARGLSGAPLLRMESPGGSFEIEKALIALGAPDAAREVDDALHPLPDHPHLSPLSAASALRLPELPGVLHHPGQWFRGYCRLLASLRREVKTALPEARWLNDPQDIALMTDKRRTQEALARAGVAVPRTIGGETPPDNYELLREAMAAEGVHRVFVKLASGSAASGVIAYQVNPVTGAEIAMTTIGVESYVTRPPVYYNSGKLKRYTDSGEIAAIVNWLYRHGAHAEQWIAKRRVGGQACDIRQLVAGGEAGHAVVRASKTPVTNLHLRSQRLNPAEAGLSPEVQERVQCIARQTAAVFPASFSMGVDVLVSEGAQRCYVADVNPFGDLLYGVRHEGLTPYEWEMSLLFGRSGGV